MDAEGGGVGVGGATGAVAGGTGVGLDAGSDELHDDSTPVSITRTATRNTAFMSTRQAKNAPLRTSKEMHVDARLQ